MTAGGATTDWHTATAIVKKVNHRNIASYRALPLPTEVKKQLDWLLLEDVAKKSIS